MAPKGALFPVLVGVVVSSIVSFVVSIPFLKSKSGADEEDLAKAAATMQELKGKKSAVVDHTILQQTKNADSVKKVVFACYSGMGSSAM
jgi:PTS system mannitol-specific IIC component